MNSHNDMTTLREVLERIAELDEKAWLYLPAKQRWHLDSEALVLQSEEVPPELEDDPDAGVPALARQHGLMQVLPIATVKEIVENARLQRLDASLVTIFEALLYYYDRDAFIRL